MEISVTFLGIPRIFIQGKEIFISKNRIRLMLLYIIHREDCTRDELANLFWEDMGEAKARASLRNTLYELKKILPPNTLKIQGHNYVGIYKNVILKKDTDLFLQEHNEKKIISLPHVIFMEGILAKDNNAYNEWVQTTREAYSDIMIRSLEEQLKKAVTLRNIPGISAISTKILELDKYNEEAYRQLILLAIESHAYTAAWKRYRKIIQLVRQDLGAEPESQTLALEKILKEKKESQPVSEGEEYFERLDLILKLKEEYEGFQSWKPYQHLLVTGELGSGKTYLIQKFLGDKKNVWQVDIPPENQSLPYSTLRSLFRIAEIPTLKNADSHAGIEMSQAMIHEGIGHLLEVLGAARHILYFNRGEFMDIESAQVIFGQLLEETQGFLLILTGVNYTQMPNPKVEALLRNHSRIQQLVIPPLSLSQSVDYLNSKGIDDENINHQEVYRLTRGNILMIERYLGRDIGVDKIKRMLSGLSLNQRQLLERLAIFHGLSDFKRLRYLSEQKSDSLLETMRDLIKKDLVVYEENLYHIKYPLYQELILLELDPAVTKELRSMLTQQLEKEPQLSYDILEELAYQYKKIGNMEKELVHALSLLRIRLDYHDQLFPVLENPEEYQRFTTMQEIDIYQEFDSIATKLKTLQMKIPYQKHLALTMELEFLQGRTMIAGGKSEEGLLHIENLEQMAQKDQNRKYLMAAYIEKIHYGIHNDKNDAMKKGIDQARNLIRQPEEMQELEKAELSRLEGLYRIRTGDLDTGEVLLQESIHIYELPQYQNTGAVPLAAAYNYMGDIYLQRGQLTQSKKYYQEAIEKIKDKGLVKSLDIFYADYGHLLWKMKELTQAKNALNQSLEYFETMGTHWKRSLVESLLGLIALQEQNRPQAMKHLRNSEIFFQKDKKELEQEYLNQLREMMEG